MFRLFCQSQIGPVIRERRDALCFTQQRLAEKANCSVSTLHRIETSSHVPSLPVFLRIMAILHIDIYLDGGPVPPSEPES